MLRRCLGSVACVASLLAVAAACSKKPTEMPADPECNQCMTDCQPEQPAPPADPLPAPFERCAKTMTSGAKADTGFFSATDTKAFRGQDTPAAPSAGPRTCCYRFPTVRPPG